MKDLSTAIEAATDELQNKLYGMPRTGVFNADLNVQRKILTEALTSIAELSREEVLSAPVKDSYKGKLWSKAIELAATAPFPEVALQHLLNRVAQQAREEGANAAVDFLRETAIMLPTETYYTYEIHGDSMEEARTLPVKEDGV